MAFEGRITGRVNGQVYELVQNGAVKQSIPLAEAHANPKLQATIARMKWEPLV